LDKHDCYAYRARNQLMTSRNTEYINYYLLQNGSENCEIRGKTKKGGRKSG
jgi:hypothetical protein